MFHLLKRSVSWYRPCEATKDSNFDRIFGEFQPIYTQTVTLLETMETNIKIWNELRSNLRSALDVALDPGNAQTQTKVFVYFIVLLHA